MAELTQPPILFWPLSVERDRKGCVIGWRSKEVAIAAGLIYDNDEAPSRATSGSGVQLLRTKIQQMLPACFCCDCSSTENSICCGCTRKMCLKELDVIAVFDPTASLKSRSTSNSDNTDGLPLIVVTDCGDCMPLWFRETPRELHQVIYYQDLTVNYIPVNCWKGPISKSILPRLSHASSILKVLEKHDDGCLANVRKSITVLQPRLPCSRSNLIDALLRCNLFDTLLRYSLFVSVTLGDNRQQLGVKGLMQAFSSPSLQKDDRPPLHGTCNSCRKNTTLPQTMSERSREERERTHLVWRSSVEIASGLVFSLVVAFLLSEKSLSFFRLYQYHYQLLRLGIQWLNNIPIGFKLNERMTQTIGLQVQSLLDLHEQILYQHISMIPASSRLTKHVSFAAFGCCFGGTGILAILIDFLRLGTFHLTIFAACSRRVCSAELYLLRALWCMFRGKKRNTLRLRTDTMAYDSTQLLLGTLLFALALFLFTTILVYHTFFACAHAVAILLLSGLCFAYRALELFPWGALVCRVSSIRRDAMIVYLEINQDRSQVLEGIEVDISTLGTSFECYSTIVKRALVPAICETASCAIAIFFSG
jgi:hypothetical protein